MEYTVTKTTESGSSWLTWVSLGVMTYVYVVGELSHFLLGIVSRPMSQELHYGDHACLPNPQVPEQSPECRTLNSSSCGNLLEEDNNTTCVWDYSGLGLDYQVLAGPAFVAVFTTAGVIIGFISDKFNRKVVVTVCCGVLTLATGLTGAAMNYWQLVILRMTTSAGESAFTPACSSMISDMFHESQRALALGIFNWGIYFGYGLSYAVGNFITAANIVDMGWRWSYIVTGMMGVVATLLLFLVVKEPPRASQAEVTQQPPRITSINEFSKVIKADPADIDTEFTKIYNSKNDVSSPTGSRLTEGLLGEESGPKAVVKALLQPAVLVLALAACIRHTAGFSWAYNTQLYFLTYYPNFNIGLWVMCASIVGGSLGVAVGGFVSDRLVKKLGVKARLYVLAASQLIATPFAAGVLYFPPPGCFFILLGSYVFAEMWFGVLFAVLLELVPKTVQSTSIAVFLFVMNNIGGNVPVIVDPLSHLLTYRGALYVMYPGMYLVSALFFFLSSFFL
ncbi:protein spinster homolog 1-like [Homarus americanus]|uniref:protein spinster homolog 1-like n=1 Tax=Homarus americanus TaxID=6706 RepID=UPI001C43B46B|nr:protein spinster homolog 1-like [Homarus americanus]